MSSALGSLTSGDFTFSFSKYSCMKEMYYAHVTFSYLVMLCGFGCLITRAVPFLKWLHVWFGRLYWVTMMWATGTSLLINNTGLPGGVLISFLWVLGFMTIAWPIINIHQINMTNQATKNVAEQIKVRGGANISQASDLTRMIGEEKGRIAANKTLRQRIFSLKALHGALMVTSWINIIGRVFVTKLDNEFTCYTYPYYKQIDSKAFNGSSVPLTPVPEVDPNYMRLPWARTGLVTWGIILSIVPILACFAIGALWVTVERKFSKPAQSVTSAGDDTDRK